MKYEPESSSIDSVPGIMNSKFGIWAISKISTSGECLQVAFGSIAWGEASTSEPCKNVEQERTGEPRNRRSLYNISLHVRHELGLVRYVTAAVW